MTFKKNDVVRAKVTVPQGPVVKLRMDDDGNVEYLVEWSDGEATHQRWYTEDQIEAAE
jgi:hypothetical protein